MSILRPREWNRWSQIYVDGKIRIADDNMNVNNLLIFLLKRCNILYGT